MNDDSIRYREIFDRMALLAGVAATMDPEDVEFVSEILFRAEAVGPIFYPTEWQWKGGAGNLEAQRKLLDAFVCFWRVARELKVDLGAEVAP